MPTEAAASLLIELCSLCPVEPACHREQMLDHVGCKRGDGAPATAFAVKGQPYRCWLLSLRDGTPPA